MAESGATAVIGGHAHAVMGTEWHGDVPIVYGLGNLLFDYGDSLAAYPNWRLGVIACLTIHDDRVTELELRPTLGKPDDGCTRLLSRDEETSFMEYYAEISSRIDDSEAIEQAWRQFCAGQVPHLTRECGKALLAMSPYVLFGLAGKWGMKHAPRKVVGLFRKGVSVFRALIACENHAEMLTTITELLRTGQFSEAWSGRKAPKAWLDFEPRRQALQSSSGDRPEP